MQRPIHSFLFAVAISVISLFFSFHSLVSHIFRSRLRSSSACVALRDSVLCAIFITEKCIPQELPRDRGSGKRFAGIVNAFRKKNQMLVVAAVCRGNGIAHCSHGKHEMCSNHVVCSARATKRIHTMSKVDRSTLAGKPAFSRCRRSIALNSHLHRQLAAERTNATNKLPTIFI